MDPLTRRSGPRIRLPCSTSLNWYPLPLDRIPIHIYPLQLPPPPMPRSFTISSKYPTLRQVLFSPHTPYVPPRDSPIAMSAWRWRIWFESTFGLVSMEPWEKYTVGGFTCGSPTPSMSDMTLRSSLFSVLCSGFLFGLVWLYGPRRSGCTQGAFPINTWIQTELPLSPECDHVTKRHFPVIMRNTLRFNILPRHLFGLTRGEVGRRGEGRHERGTRVAHV